MQNSTLINQSVSKETTNAIYLITRYIGVLMGVFSSINHGIFEILQGNQKTSGILIQAIGINQRFWINGTEEAFAIIPNYLVSGILTVITGIAIVIWSLKYLDSKHGTMVFLALFIISFLNGGGIGQLAFFVPAWAFGRLMHSPLVWWKDHLPEGSWHALSKLWQPLLLIATLSFLVGLEIAIFGYFPGLTNPLVLQNTAMQLVFGAALLVIFSYVGGIANQLQLSYKKNEPLLNWRKL